MTEERLSIKYFTATDVHVINTLASVGSQFVQAVVNLNPQHQSLYNALDRAVGDFNRQFSGSITMGMAENSEDAGDEFRPLSFRELVLMDHILELLDEMGPSCSCYVERTARERGYCQTKNAVRGVVPKLLERDIIFLVGLGTSDHGCSCRLLGLPRHRVPLEDYTQGIH